MNIKKLLIGFISTFAITFVVCVIVTYLWNLIVHGQTTVDWQTSFRLSVILGVVLPIVRRPMAGKGKIESG